MHAALAVVGVWLCFGEDAWLDLHRALFRWLPGYGAFRNPTRSLVVTSFSVALLAAEGLDGLRAGATDRAWRRRALRAALVLGALALAANVLPRGGGVPVRPRARGRDLAARGGPRARRPRLARRRLGAAAPAGGRARGRSPRARSRSRTSGSAFGDMNPVAPAAGERPPLADLVPLLPEPPAPRRVAVIAKWGQSANAAAPARVRERDRLLADVIQRVRSLLEATVDDRVVPPGPVRERHELPAAAARLGALAAPRCADRRVGPRRSRCRRSPTLEREWEHPLVAYRAPALPRVFWAGVAEARRRRGAGRADAAGRDRESRGARAGGRKADRDRDRDRDRDPAETTSGRQGTAGRISRAGILGRHRRVRSPLDEAEPAGPIAAERIAILPDRLEATVVAPADGWAVILDPWFPGWSATLDGASVPIVRADFAFMAVRVAAGRHALTLTYRNEEVRRGAIVSAATAALLLLVVGGRRLAIERCRRRRDAAA